MPAPLPRPTLSPIRLEPTEGGTDEFPGAFGGCLCGLACLLGAVGGQKDLCGEDANWGNLLILYALSLSLMMPSGEPSRSFVAKASIHRSACQRAARERGGRYISEDRGGVI